LGAAKIWEIKPISTESIMHDFNFKNVKDLTVKSVCLNKTIKELCFSCHLFYEKPVVATNMGLIHSKTGPAIVRYSIDGSCVMGREYYLLNSTYPKELWEKAKKFVMY
jgi:hypothetical protein